MVHQKIRLEDVYRMGLVPWLLGVPMESYRVQSPNFLGNFPLTCLCLSSQWAICLMYYTKRCALARSIERTWFRVHMMFLCGDIGQHVPKMPKLFGKFPIDAPLPIFPVGTMSHVLHQKMRLDEIYRTHLASSLHDVPMRRYRSTCAHNAQTFWEISQ